LNQPPKLPKDPGKLRLGHGPVGKQSALLSIQNSIRLQQRRHDLQCRCCWELGEAQEGDPQLFRAGAQGTQRIIGKFALVGPPEALPFRLSRQQHQAPPLFASRQGKGFMQHGLVIEAPLTLQCHDNREAGRVG
jgi:hypothetical protein